MTRPPLKKRILLVEDDLPTVEAALLKLKKSGFKTDFAEDGQIGLKKLRREGPFDGVLLDLRMPKGDGFQFLEGKMKDPKVRKVPVIIFSNLNQPEFVKRALDLGAIGYLVKANHSLDEIVKELKKCLETNQCQIDH